jgi:hypothetical protein
MYISKDPLMDVRSFSGRKYKYFDNILRARNLKVALFKILSSESVTPLPEVLPGGVSSNPKGYGVKQRLSSDKFPTRVNLMFTDTAAPTR